MNPAENILSKLRYHTGTLHAELEKTPLSKALLDENVSIENYVAYLQKMRGVVDFYENKVFPVLAETLPDLSERQKLSLIDADLSNLLPDTSEPLLFKHPKALSPQVPYALGCMYVIEGSTLGGKVIQKHISKTLGIEPGKGASFFDGYGNETGHFWKSFLATLQTYSSEHDADPSIIAGAADTFRSIKKHFEY